MGHTNQSSSETYELTKTAASAAGSAAKQLFKSFGSKVTKDVKSFTKSELKNVGVDTNKPIIKKPTIKKAAPPSELKSVNLSSSSSSLFNKKQKAPPPAPASIKYSRSSPNKKKTKSKPPPSPQQPKWKRNANKTNQSSNGSMKNK